MNQLILPVLASFLFVAGAIQIHASSVRANALVADGDQTGGNILGTFGDSTETFTPVFASGSSSYDLTEFGGNGTLNFDGEAMAEASYNALRASANGTVTNTFFDPNYNRTDDVGIPSAYVSQGLARFSQTLQYGGTANNYTSTYQFRLTGTVAGTGRAAISIDITHGNNQPQNFFYDMNGDYDLDIFSQTYVHGSSPQEFQLSLNVFYSFDMDNLQPGGNYSGSSSFSNTLEVTAIDIRDENGTLQNQGFITSDSGETFTIAAVPEPSSIALALAALGIVSAAAAAAPAEAKPSNSSARNASRHQSVVRNLQIRKRML